MQARALSVTCSASESGMVSATGRTMAATAALNSITSRGAARSTGYPVSGVWATFLAKKIVDVVLRIFLK